MNVMEKLQEQFRVKVIKKEDDTRVSIAGERFINPSNTDHDGTTNSSGELASYAVIPAHHAEHIQANNKQYEYSEPFPAEDAGKK